MRRYAQADEEKIRSQTFVREWHRSGLLGASQAGELEAELRVDLKRTNPFFRLVLALFTAIIVAASLGLFVTVFEVTNDGPFAVLFFAAALACLGGAEHLTRTFRLYRFGVEETLAVASAVLVSLAAALATTALAGHQVDEAAIFAGLAAGVLAGVGIYLRFGYLYSAFGAVICAAAIPFQSDMSPQWQRIASAAVLAAIFLIARFKTRHSDDFRGDEYAIIQASAWAGVYFVLNLQFSFDWFQGFFYWWTYVMTWLLPVAGLYMGIRARDRALIGVNVAMALVTVITNKPYLRLPRHAWDPILFGVLLIGAAILVRRWLSNGPAGERHGFTALPVLASERRAVAIAATASAAIQHHAPTPAAAPSEPQFGGGASGGGGATDKF